MGLLLLAAGFMGCAHGKPYNPPGTGASAAEKKALYDEFAVSRDGDGGYRAGGRRIHPIPYAQGTAPDLLPPMAAWDLYGTSDLAWLAVCAGGLAVYAQEAARTPTPPAIGFAALLPFAALFGWESSFMRRAERQAEDRALAWNQALARDLDQPGPAPFGPMDPVLADASPTWRLGLSAFTTEHSGLDAQDYFRNSGRFDDQWVYAFSVSVGKGLGHGWLLELDSGGLGESMDPGVSFKDSGGHVVKTWDLAMTSFAPSLRLGHAWVWVLPDDWSLSAMPVAGAGEAWLLGHGTQRDGGGGQTGSYDVAASAPCFNVGLRVALAGSRHWASALELGWRWLRYDYLAVTSADGVYGGRSSPDSMAAGGPAYWDFSGPVIKVSEFAF